MKPGDLAGPAFTYPEIGATADGRRLPPGYRHVRRRASIGTGRARFDRAAQAVVRYGMLRGAGVEVQASTAVAEVGTLVLGRLGPIRAPCRVVYVLDGVDEPNCRGFAYGTLPGHPLRGEERFAVRYDPADGAVFAEVVVFSRPAAWWSRLGRPLTSLAQRVLTRRYLRAV